VQTRLSDPEVAGDQPTKRGFGSRILRAAAVFVLGGLTTAEVVAGAVGVVAVLALMWATGAVAPETLVTDPVARAAWILLVLLLLRPITWLPYVIAFLGFRRLLRGGGSRPVLRRALAHLSTIALLVLGLWLAVASIEGAGTAVQSGLAFATGSGSFETLGQFGGDWTAVRIAVLAGVVIVGRVVLPPIALDLNLFPDPVLGSADGPRGDADRVLLMTAAVGGLAAGIVAWLLARS
jgi:hypothetical protein